MMNKTGYEFGQCVEFQTMSGVEAIGYVLGPTNLTEPYDFVDETPVAMQREYCVLHLDEDGKIVCDSSVAECWIKPYRGYVPNEVFQIPKFVREFLENNLPQTPFGEEEDDT